MKKAAAVELLRANEYEVSFQIWDLPRWTEPA